MRQLRRHTVLTVGLITCLHAPLLAQQDEAEPVPAPQTPPAEAQASPAPPAGGPHFEVRPRGSHTFRADLDDPDGPGDAAGGSVAVSRAGLGLGISSQLGERARFTLDLDGEASWYDFNGAGGLVAGTEDPLDDAYRFSVSPRLVVHQSRQWAWLLGGAVDFSGEDGADFTDSLTYGGFAGVRYAFSETLALTFGVAARTELEDDPLVLPLLGLEWRINDRLRIESQGLGLRATASIDERLDFLLHGGWEMRDYRLSDDNPLPEGVARDNRVPIGAGFAWRPNDSVTITLTGGVVAWQEFTFDDSDGDEVSETNTDPAGFISLAARFTF